MSRYARHLPLLGLLLLLPLVSGCFGGGAPLPRDKYDEVRSAFVQLDQLGPGDLETRNRELGEQIAAAEKAKDSDAAHTAFLKLQRAYTWERLAGVKNDFGLLSSAVGLYQQTGSIYGSVASMRIAQIERFREKQEADRGNEQQAQVYRSNAIRALETLGFAQVDAKTFIRVPEVGFQPLQEWQLVDARTQANLWLDPYWHNTWQYKLFDILVLLCGGPHRNSSYIIMIFVIAVLAKVVTTPFSVAQFRNMRAMQLFQPELKKLQEKYKGDKQALAKAQMELMKEHKVNPASSCLPMILQMVILIQVYYGIRHYIAHFQHVHFLYLPSLANPDTILIGGAPLPGPLLILYAASMYFTQKLISMPAATPEQQQQQRLMAIMMPFLMLMIMQSLPAAFILYWLLQNVLMTGHQYLIMRPHRAADAAAAAAARALSREPESQKEAPPAAAPPEAIQRLTQGRKPTKKKKKRRY